MKTFTAKVVANKSNQTVAVETDVFRAHAKYHKILRHTIKVLAHNTLEGINEGDMVEVAACAPKSAKKHFSVVAKVK